MSKRRAEELPNGASAKKLRFAEPEGHALRSTGRSIVNREELAGAAPAGEQAVVDAQLQAELQEVTLTSEEEDNTPIATASTRQSAPTHGYDDLYLDTINRSKLDFDFEKLCSVSLSNINVYACLICGKYYQGRGPRSHAYVHALETDHHVFVNMQTKKVYVLPEGYEVLSKSLDDIKFVVDPRLSREEVSKLDREAKELKDLSNKEYRPGMSSLCCMLSSRPNGHSGFVGMNNIKANDYFNVIIQSLAHITPMRNFLILENLSQKPELVQRFSILVRKIWNPRAFKSHVSPHELLQQISRQSQKKFDLLNQSDPVEFLSWFLNNLHLALGGSKTKPGTSIIQKAFQGQFKIESQQITAKADAGDRLRFEEAAEVQVDMGRFLILTLDLPPAPLFQDELDENIIPQVSYLFQFFLPIVAKQILGPDYFNTRQVQWHQNAGTS
jgi:U4/U6.U5 tri-snRNP-associated protein 2